jgi:hypothetical protein
MFVINYNAYSNHATKGKSIKCTIYTSILLTKNSNKNLSTHFESQTCDISVSFHNIAWNLFPHHVSLEIDSLGAEITLRVTVHPVGHNGRGALGVGLSV